jgi:hypothetical protein
MNIYLDRSGSLTALAMLLDQCIVKDKAQGCLILSCDDNGYTRQTLDPILQNSPIPLFGGIFPQIIYGTEKLTQGTIVIGFGAAPQVHLVSNLSDANQNLDLVLEAQLWPRMPGQTLFVFVDGLARRIHALLDALFHTFGLDVNYIGGGAGSLSLQQKPCLITNAGLQHDCAVLAQVAVTSGIGVSHGWQTIDGPFQITAAQGNTIHTLDWRPAFDVYQEIVYQRSQQRITRENFFAIAKSHPFGVKRLGAEKIVRDPILATPDGALVCVGEVSESAFVDILGGNVDSLVRAAGQALALAQRAYRGEREPTAIFFIDCISRVLFLEEHFAHELAAVHRPAIPLIGALTLGEIANSGFDYLEFHNKTAVVGVLG